MKKKTKQILTKIGIALMALLSGGVLILHKKNDGKTPLKQSTTNNDTELFI